MRVQVRVSLLALLAGVIVAVAAPAAAQANVEIEKFVGINCKAAYEGCGEKTVGVDAFGEPLEETVEPTLEESEEQGYTQAAGHVPYGVTDFMVKHTGDYAKGEAVPDGVVTHVRVDVASGLAASPAAVPQCSTEEFGAKEDIEGTGFYAEPKCKAGGAGPHETGPESTVIGEEKATVYVEGVGDVALTGVLYNLVPPTATATTPARSALYGAALKLPKALTKGALEKAFAEKGNPLGKPTEEYLEEQQYYAHTLVEGNVEWGKEAKGTGAGDYHDYFEVNVSPSLPVIRSRQLDYGTAGNGSFITNATKCPGDHTTYVTLEGVNGGTTAEVEERLKGTAREVTRRPYETLLGLDNCQLVPFEPSFALTPATTASDEADGITTEVGLKRFPEEEIDSSELQSATFTLPEGMTLNPSAAGGGLEACSPGQARIHSSTFGTSCPPKSELGTVSLEVPTLREPLTGEIYLGGPESSTGAAGPITGGEHPETAPEYKIYLNAETTRYGVDVRLEGTVKPNPTTGQVTTTFAENPEQPFTKLTLHFKEGALAPIANPLGCVAATTNASFSPYSGTATVDLASSFTVTGCSSPIPFALSQSTVDQTANAGANTSFTFNLGRPSGDQYLSQVKTVLPAGLVGRIPAVKQCPEPQANAGTCTSESEIGTAKVTAGAGTEPYSFSGHVYLTGPYNGAPFGLSIVVPAVAGPFSLGNVVTRASININQETSRVTIASTLPTIHDGIPLRIRSISIEVNKQGFLLNPTNCGVLATESTLTSTLGATQSLSTPFQVANCSALPFKPTFGAATVDTSGKKAKDFGTSLETTLNVPTGSANVKSVLVQLPLQLPSRDSTLKKACLAATFEANPYNCPSGSFVGGVRANTPTLASKLKGPAILVSHGGEAFPDLDLVLEAEGVRVILVGHTKITKGITTTDFASTPDVPVSSITVNLPIGAHSALALNGELCHRPLLMPTTITAQSGVVFKQNTKIKVAGCGVKITGHKVIGNTAYITVQTFAAGRVSGSGKSLATRYEHFKQAKGKATIKVPLSKKGKGRRRPFKVKLRVGFLPKQKGVPTSTAFTTVNFR